MIAEKDVVVVSSKIHEAADKIWKVVLFGPDNYKAAVISHYVHSGKKKLKKPALEFAKDILQGYLDERINNVVAEEALQYLIRYNSEIPFPTYVDPKFRFVDLFAGIGNHSSEYGYHGAQRLVFTLADGFTFSDGGKQFIMFGLVWIIFSFSVKLVHHSTCMILYLCSAAEYFSFCS